MHLNNGPEITKYKDKRITRIGRILLKYKLDEFPQLLNIIKGEMDTSMFIISKSLSGYYKNPEGIAHKVLADRMAERNPGNKPKPNDRIPYIYTKIDDKEFVGYERKIEQILKLGILEKDKFKRYSHCENSKDYMYPVIKHTMDNLGLFYVKYLEIYLKKA